MSVSAKTLLARGALLPAQHRPSRLLGTAPRAQSTPQRTPRADNEWSSGSGAVPRRRVLAALPPCACAVCCAGSAAAQLAVRNDALDSLFAASMATGMAEYEQSIAPLKRQLFSELLGGLPAAPAGEPAQLLELGVGTGPNLAFYSGHYGLGGDSGDSNDRNDSSSSSSSGGGGGGGSGASTEQVLPPLHITGVDPNPYMREYLQQNLAASGWPEGRFSWVQGQAEALPLEDASCDAVVCTLVLCSVREVQPVLDEVARVLKPGGALLFIEHTTARLQAQPLLWLGQRALEPLQRALADNCHLSRDPLPAIQAYPAFRGGVEARRLSVEGASLISPHVAGIARQQQQQQQQQQEASSSGAPAAAA